MTKQTRTTPGAALGAGGEYALGSVAPAPLARSVSLFAQYEHIWWSSNTTNTPAAVPTLNFHWHRDSDIIRTGIRLRF